MPSSDYTPEVADVALFLRTRTRDTNGAELGTFTSATRPTDTEVEAIIADTIVNMEDDIGVDIDARLWSSAKRVTALRAAMAVEVSYFSEQVAANRSVYPQLKEWYEEDLDKLNMGIVETAEGGDIGSDAGENTPMWGGGDLPLLDGSSPSGVDQSLGSTWPEALGAFHDTVNQEEVAMAAVLGTTSDTPSTTPGGGSIASYLRKIRDLLSGTLKVQIVGSGGSGSATGGLTDDELRASPVAVLGPATDAELRATPLPVSTGGLTNAELRGAPLSVDPGAGPFPVSASALPLPVGAATEATTAALATATGAPSDTAWASGPGTVIALLKKIASTAAIVGLTDAELRASALHVIVDSGVTSGLTDAQLRATPVPVSGTVATGGLTDAQLRATPVPVSGGLTDTQLRASAVPVSAAALPLPSGAATETTLGSVLTGIGAPGDAAATTTGSAIAQLRRIANLLAATLTVSGTVSVSGSVAVTGPLTDTQLRASAVPTSLASQPLPTGASTEATLAAVNTVLGSTADAASSTTGTVNAHLRSIAAALAGTLAVSGGLTDTQLRASAVPVSLASVPSHAVTNAGTFAVQDALADTALGAPGDAAATTTGSVIAQLRRIANLVAGTLTVTGTVAVSGSVAVTGTFWQATQPVSGTFWQATQPISAASLPLPTGAAADATLTGGTQKSINRGGAKGATAAADVTSTASGADHQGLDVVLYDAAGSRLGTSGTPLRVDTTGTTTQPVSAASLPLPTGAATETSAGLAATALGAPGDAAATTTGSVIAQLRRIANLLAGTITVNTGTVAVTGTFWQATQPVSAASLPLPTGASTETSLAALLATAGATSDAGATGAGSMNAHLRSIAAALAGTLTVTGGGGGTQFAEDVPHTTGDLGSQMLGVRKDTAASLAGTDGDYMPMIFDASGRQWVNVGASVLPTGASTETSLAALLATAGATSDAAATGAGSMNAHLRSIAAALAGTLTVSGGGGGVQFAEDAVHTTGDLGTMALGVRKDTATALAGTDGDYMPAIFDASGRMHVNPGTVAVTGTFFQGTQPVSAAALPLPSGASTETTLAAVNTVLGSSADAASSTTGTINAHLRSIAAALAGTVAVSGTFWQATQPISAASLPLPTGAATETTLAAANTVLGASADAAATGAGTINAHLRSIAAFLTGTLAVSAASLPLPAGAATAAKQPAIGTAGSPSVDVISTIQPDATANGSVTSATVAASITTLNGQGSATIQVVSAGTTCTVTFEGTTDGTNWVTILGIKVGGTGTLDGTNGGVVGLWQFDCAGMAGVRARVSTYGSGTVTVYIRASQSIAAAGIDNPLPPGGNLIGGVNIYPSTSGGWAISRLLSAATTNATTAKASAGHLGGWYLFNANAATRYLKIYNKASNPTVGTDTPVLTIPIPAGGAANMEWAQGIQFTTGIAFALTTGIADADTGAVAANDITVNLMYK